MKVILFLLMWKGISMAIKPGNTHERVADSEGGGSVRDRFQQIGRETSQSEDTQNIKQGHTHERVADTQGGGSVKDRFQQIGRESSPQAEAQESQEQGQGATSVRGNLNDMKNENSNDM